MPKIADCQKARNSKAPRSQAAWSPGSSPGVTRRPGRASGAVYATPFRAISRLAGRGARAVVMLALAGGVQALTAQARAPVVEQAIRHRDAGEFAEAVRLLDPHVNLTPDDREAVRILAQTLYWLHRRADARRVYEEALGRHADDATLRLQYARMLAETGDRRRATEVLEPLQEDPQFRPQADALLGAMAYWSGDFVGARRLLRRAMVDTTQLEARRQLAEIAAVGAPWSAMTTDLRTDDQPLSRLDLQFAGGASIVPLLAITAKAGIGQVESEHSVTRRIVSAEAGFSHYAPTIRLESEGALGVLSRGTDDADWTGRLRASFRLPSHVKLGITWQKEPYFYTAGSLQTPVMTRTISGAVALATPRGWLGEMSIQRTRYPDANTLRTEYAWLMAPVARTPGSQLQLGYGVTLQDATENRFALVRPDQPWPPTDPRFVADGHYVPYHTPADLVVHSVLANYEVRAGRARLRAGGSYGVRATDRVPVFQAPAIPVPGDSLAVERAFYSRTFTPWTARASVDFTMSQDLTVGLAGESTRSAFYTATTARAWLMYRFVGAAMRRATQR